MTLSKNEEFNFGDLNDAIPFINSAPQSFEGEIGEIVLDNFTSQDESGNIGFASFEQFTGRQTSLQQGDFLPGFTSQKPVNIELDTDFFISATIKRGSVRLFLTNELGFDIDRLDIVLKSGNTRIGSVEFFNFFHNQSQNDLIQIPENSELSNLNIDVSISWSDQQMQDDSGDLIINEMQGENLTASRVEAAIGSQKFYSSGTTTLDDDEFLFTESDHFIEIESGSLTIRDIINNLDLDLDVVQISIPAIRNYPYTPADSLVFKFSGENKITRNNDQSVELTTDLTDFRIFANGNSLQFNVFAVTEDLLTGNTVEPRVFKETDTVSAVFELNDLSIKELFGRIKNRQERLTGDDPANGELLDIFIDNETEIIEISGISDLSNRLQGVEFTNSSITLSYTSNIGVETTVFGMLMGIDASGNHFFLSGKDGSEFVVQPGDPIDDLRIDGAQISPKHAIRFDIDIASNQLQQVSSIEFNRQNSNVVEFLNQLPAEIRFLGIADLNSSESVGRLTNPVLLDSGFSIDIPLSIQMIAEASYTDTTRQNLKVLPGDEDDHSISDGILEIKYQNGIPLGVDLFLEFLDGENQQITSVPLTNDPSIILKAATVDGTGFSETKDAGIAEFRFTNEQLTSLYRTRQIRIFAELETTNTEEVKIRGNDSISISINGRFKIETKVN